MFTKVFFFTQKKLYIDTEKKNGIRNYFTESLHDTNDIHSNFSSIRVENELEAKNNSF